MSYDEDEEVVEPGFKIDDDAEVPLEIPDDLDFGLDEEDPDRDR
ncbi:MAG: hypothetical protein ABIS26_00120 [Candidatus Paceibacterota bacterium]